jgi:hypothetical protein
MVSFTLYQCCGSKMCIRDLGSEFFHPGFRIQGRKDSGSASKNLSISIPKTCYLSSWKYDPGCSSRIQNPGSRILDPYFFQPGSRGQKSTGSRIRNIALFLRQQENYILYLPYCHIIYLNNSMVFLWSNISLKIFTPKIYCNLLNPG